MRRTIPTIPDSWTVHLAQEPPARRTSRLSAPGVSAERSRECSSITRAQALRREQALDLRDVAPFQGLEGEPRLKVDPRAIRAAYQQVFAEHMEQIQRIKGVRSTETVVILDELRTTGLGGALAGR